MRIGQSFKSKENILQFIKFGIVGLSNTIIALLVYYMLLLIQINYLIANTTAWLVSVFNAFYWNNKFVFKNDSTWFKALIKTYVSYGLSFLLGTLLLCFLVEVCGISTALAPLLSLVLTIPLNFFLNKFWTFK